MKTILFVFLIAGALAFWWAIYSMIKKAVSKDKYTNPIPELVFMSLYSFVIVWCWADTW